MFSSIFLLPPECLQLSNVQRFPDLETFVRAVREISQSKQYEGSVFEEARHFSSMVAIFPTIKTLHNYSRELKVEKYLSIHFETFFKPLCFFQSGRLWCFNKSSPLVRSVVAGTLLLKSTILKTYVFCQWEKGHGYPQSCHLSLCFWLWKGDLHDLKVRQCYIPCLSSQELL